MMVLDIVINSYPMFMVYYYGLCFNGIVLYIYIKARLTARWIDNGIIDIPCRRFVVIWQWYHNGI